MECMRSGSCGGGGVLGGSVLGALQAAGAKANCLGVRGQGEASGLRRVHGHHRIREAEKPGMFAGRGRRP
jgi:hypothetical protein